MWAAVTEGQLTDTEFVVGDRIFAAHRAVVAARSPVFAAMFGTDMKESRGRQVDIEDIDARTFEEFLYFLYTGQLRRSSADVRSIWSSCHSYFQYETLSSGGIIPSCRQISGGYDQIPLRSCNGQWIRYRTFVLPRYENCLDVLCSSFWFRIICWAPKTVNRLATSKSCGQ